jgi:Xaa-Pro aminopeptidase
MDKLTSLRKIMTEERLSALLIPHADEFQGMTLPPHAERLKWLTGFTGSAGFVVVTLDKAAFFTDSRYLLQAKEELPSDYEIHNTASLSPAQLVSNILETTEKVGYDPWLFTEIQIQKYTHSLTPLESHPLDKLWINRPLSSHAPVVLYPLEYAGEETQSKRNRIVDSLKADHVLVTAPDSVAWLLNIRGSDVPYSPIVNAMCLLHKDGTYDLFVDLQKVTEPIRHSLQQDGGHVFDFNTLISHLKKLKGKCQVDPKTTPIFLLHTLQTAGVSIIRKCDPCVLPKALKNPTECDRARHVHLQDGLSLCRFLAWIEEQPLQGETTEITAAEKLYNFRKQGENFMGASFQTISSFGPHGAIVHYHPSAASDVPLKRNGIYLIDSGGQYLGGTTDVTRTLALGTPSVEEKTYYTRVLKGHIALANAIFPANTTGGQLDGFARQFLWQIGADYGHGTGHGVGSYLNVHEAPPSISPRALGEPLRPGMILSNEPGYYKEGHYGIRIESLMLVKEAPNLTGFYNFEILTLVPLDLTLIDISLLTKEETAWIEDYHFHVFNTLAPYLDEKTKQWLKKTTQF